MIRCDSKQGLRLEAKTLERVVQLTDERVGVGHLAVIRPVAISRRVGFGRLVRIVWFVQMDPQADAVGRALGFEPGNRRAHRLGARLLQCLQQVGALGLRKIVVVPIESPPESTAPLQHDGRNEGAGVKARPFQDFGEERR